MQQLYAFISGLLLLNTLNLQAQTTTFYQLHPEQLLTTFYGGSDWDSTATIWTPNYEDGILLANTTDQVRTTLDTIFDFSENDRPQAVAVFATSIEADCRSCGQYLGLAKFDYDPNDRYWTVKSFKKLIQNHGSWGQFGEVSLERIGMNNPIYAINLLGGYTQGGITIETYTLLSLSHYTETFPKIFSAEVFFSNEGMAMTEEEKILRKTSIEYQENKDIHLSTTENGKVISNTVYQYQQDESQPNVDTYQKVCK